VLRGSGLGRVDGESVTADSTQNYSKFELTIIFLIRGLLLCRFLGGLPRDETTHPSRTRAIRGDGVDFAHWISTGADDDPATRLQKTF